MKAVSGCKVSKIVCILRNHEVGRWNSFQSHHFCSVPVNRQQQVILYALVYDLPPHPICGTKFKSICRSSMLGVGLLLAIIHIIHLAEEAMKYTCFNQTLVPLKPQLSSRPQSLVNPNSQPTLNFLKP